VLEIAGVVIGAVVILGGSIAYVVGLKADIAVANSEIRSLQRSQDSWIAVFREDIRRIEGSLERMFGQTPTPGRGSRTQPPTSDGREERLEKGSDREASR
jgi:hypothetical protein